MPSQDRIELTIIQRTDPGLVPYVYARVHQSQGTSDTEPCHLDTGEKLLACIDIMEVDNLPTTSSSTTDALPARKVLWALMDMDNEGGIHDIIAEMCLRAFKAGGRP